MRIFGTLLRVFCLSLAAVVLAAASDVSASAVSADRERQALLTYTRRAVESHLGQKQLLDTVYLPHSAGPWRIRILFYHQGSLLARAEAEAEELTDALEEAAARLVSSSPVDLAGRLSRGRFRITAEAGTRAWHLAEYRGKAFEIASPGDVTAVRLLDQRLVRSQIREQKEYLLRQLDPAHHALFKRYDALTDTAEPDLRTIYTASGLWSLLQLNDLERDERIVREVRPMAGFLLGMQVTSGEHRGAFYYSINRLTGLKRPRFVVGTASKTIFTLLELYRRGRDPRYLESAREAGDWLVRQTAPDGRVFPVISQTPSGRWRTSESQSVLYSGQVLTALSRLYAVTQNDAYKKAADRIAARLLEHAKSSGYFVGDDFRPANTVSTSWLAMAFLSYSRVEPNPEYREAVYRAARELIRHQIRDFSNVLDDGRYADTWATSGNGWMNEVLVEVYRQSVSDGRQDSRFFLNAITRSTRWLIQNIYSYENSYHIPNPDRAHGGSIRNSVEEAVRTDAVCHGVNSLIGYWQILKDGIHFEIPESRLPA